MKEGRGEGWKFNPSSSTQAEEAERRERPANHRHSNRRYTEVDITLSLFSPLFSPFPLSARLRVLGGREGAGDWRPETQSNAVFRFT